MVLAGTTPLRRREPRVRRRLDSHVAKPYVPAGPLALLTEDC